MITIDEAAQKWSCSKNNVFSYIYKKSFVRVPYNNPNCRQVVCVEYTAF